MRPILFSFGRLNFYSYGFFTALGFLAGGILVNYLARRKRILTKKDGEYFLIDGLILSLVGAVIGARVGYFVLYDIVLRFASSSHGSGLLGGGFVFYAGLLVGLLTFVHWLRRHQAAILPWLDVVIVGITSGLAISEIGGYLNDALIAHMINFCGSIVVSVIAYLLVRTEKKAGTAFTYGLFLLFSVYFFVGFAQTEPVQWLGFVLSQWVSLLGMVGVTLWRIKLSRA